VGERARIWFLRGWVALGAASLAWYFGWWLGAGRLGSPLLFAALVLSALFHGFQMGGAWLFYLAARRRAAPPPPPADLEVDVFVTACGEDAELVRRSLEAALRLRGPHRTWLLDDGDDPRLAALARRLGAGYLTRPGREQAKAGNLNAALARTEGGVVAIFDVDHVPEPAFLERTLGHFADPRVGFVQVMLSFANAGASWVARAAIESSFDFHNPTAMGMDALDTVTMHGSNALIRRAALDSIDGYRAGLAEDLATSLALHAAGWRSVYVAEPLAPGLAPVDLAGWFTQQLKWSRGVFETLLTELPGLFRRLSPAQRLAYLVRSTYYWIGSLTAVHLGLLAAALFLGGRAARVDVETYLLHYLPLLACYVAIRRQARRCWSHPSTPTGVEWNGMLLVYATWPVYTLAWLMAICRVPLGFRPTPKTPAGDLHPLWLAPQLAIGCALAAGLGHAAFGGGGAQPLVVLSSVVQLVLLGAFFARLGLPRRAAQAPARRSLLRAEAGPQVVE
jgi:cellulose synthase (UDP-forming)